MQLQINKEKLISQLEDCNREPWKQPKKPVKQSIPPTWPAVLTDNSSNPLQSLQSEQETIDYNDNEITPSLDSQITEIRKQRKVQFTQLKASNEIKHTKTTKNVRNTSKQENKSTSEKDKPQRIHPQHEATETSRPSKVNTRRNDIYVVGDSLWYNIDEHRLRTKSSTVRVRCFPGASLEDMIDFVKPIARKKPTHFIITAELTIYHQQNYPNFHKKLKL